MRVVTFKVDVAGKSLYNGNIATITLALSKFRGGDPVGYSYGYDQLNRLKEMQQHSLTAATTSWGCASTGEPYKESYIYDKIGNLIGDIKTHLYDIKWTVYGKLASMRKDDPFTSYTDP